MNPTGDFGSSVLTSDAWLSADEQYRYTLSRAWGEGPRVAWCMLNPSTADADLDDPTIRRCIGFSKSWGAGRLVVVNRFALRASEPRDLLGHPDPCGPCNIKAITDTLTISDMLVVGWGTFVKRIAKRGVAGTDVLGIAERLGVPTYCLGRTKDGYPKHPLYLGASTALELMTPIGGPT